MKQATTKIVQIIPCIETALQADSPNGNLTEVEDTFLQLARFFENPKGENFNLKQIYDMLEEDWLEFALEAIFDFFTQDTYLIQQKSISMVTDHSWYLNQSQFANYLAEKGLSFDRHKMGMYVKRGNIPTADLVVAGTKYWTKDTCERYLQKQTNNA